MREDGKNHFAPFVVAHHDFQTARNDDVQCIGRIAGGDDGRAARLADSRIDQHMSAIGAPTHVATVGRELGGRGEVEGGVVLHPVRGDLGTAGVEEVLATVRGSHKLKTDLAALEYYFQRLGRR